MKALLILFALASTCPCRNVTNAITPILAEASPEFQQLEFDKLKGYEDVTIVAKTESFIVIKSQGKWATVAMKDLPDNVLTKIENMGPALNPVFGWISRYKDFLYKADPATLFFPEAPDRIGSNTPSVTPSEKKWLKQRKYTTPKGELRLGSSKDGRPTTNDEVIKWAFVGIVSSVVVCIFGILVAVRLEERYGKGSFGEKLINFFVSTSIITGVLSFVVAAFCFIRPALEGNRAVYVDNATNREYTMIINKESVSIDPSSNICMYLRNAVHHLAFVNSDGEISVLILDLVGKPGRTVINIEGINSYSIEKGEYVRDFRQ